MKKSISISIILGLLIVCTIPSTAQHFLSTRGKAIVNENLDTILLRGMGLGGWMVQEGYMLQTAGFAGAQHQIRATIEELIGEADTDVFYEAWLNNHVRKADIDSLKSWGFNSVRLPMHYNLFTLPIEEEPVAGHQTWLTKGFELTDSLISWCKQNEMYVILDLHAAPGGQGYDQGISDYDPSKPSLWESPANKAKTVALWKRLAERYADEQWVAGYDLLNETNWDLPGGLALKNLYREITDSIRTVDTQHIIFIEGNWFANDFTGLTPPWDDQIVYSPHKYWSYNEEEVMQWVIDIRNTYNVPLYLGESGENSNVWFRNAIRLLEDLDIGWAWWPMKKIEAIAGPLSVIKTPEYQVLLDYWNGNGGSTPTAEFATAALMEITEGLKIENCFYQKDVIDAMFRQVYSDETIPYSEQTIPGIVYATNYDMGVIGQAYDDIVSATYQVSTGDFTAWNSGWAYRNDGVDIEVCQDNVNTNGYNVGFMDNTEWMQYEVTVEESGVYEVHVRAASGGSGGRFHLKMDGSDITSTSFVPPTGGWQNWQTTVFSDIILDSNDKKLRFYVDQAGFNVSSFEFIKTGENTTAIPTEFVAAITVDEYTVQMNTNKFLNNTLPSTPADFEIFVDGVSIPITDVIVDANNSRIIRFSVDYILKSTEDIKISYSGGEVTATDETTLNNFMLEDVENTLDFVHQIPGLVQAEDYFFQSGIELEATTDMGGGENIGFLDPGDYLDYEVNITSGGSYNLSFRTASQTSSGAISLQLIDQAGNVNLIPTPSFPMTGGWQTWITTTSINVDLPVGRYVMRIIINQSPFNLNWIRFEAVPLSSTKSYLSPEDINIFPNPSQNVFNIQADLNEVQDVQIEVYNALGAVVFYKKMKRVSNLSEVIDLADVGQGVYWMRLRLADGSHVVRQLVKTRFK